MRNNGTAVSGENDLADLVGSVPGSTVVIHAGGVLTDEQVVAYGRFTGELSLGEVERFFYLDDADRSATPIGSSAGLCVQLGTVRAVGRFLEDPLDVPWPAVEFLAEQLGIGDASCMKEYVQRPRTPYEHAWERGITWLNAVNDQVAGIGQMVVPGTPRDSLFILDTLLNLDAGPRPEGRDYRQRLGV